MAYIKFKELTHYFNFYKELEVGELPDYVFHYLTKDENIHAVYSTLRDKCIFTDRKIILFDRKGTFGITKKIHFFPYSSISSSAIVFKKSSVSILLTIESGYQLKLNYVKMTPEGKSHIRKVYYKMIESIEK